MLFIKFLGCMSVINEIAASEEAAFLLSLDQFLQDHFFRVLANAVHPADPGHLIFCFQFFIDAFCLGHLGDDLIHLPSTGLVDFCQVLVKLAG